MLFFRSMVSGRCIGLIGGLGVGATIYYYRELAKAHEKCGRLLNLVMVHADVDRVLGAVQAGDKLGLAKYLADLIARLASAGAEFAVIPAVAPHIAIAEVIKISPLAVVNLIEELKREVEARKLRRVALFGTRFAVESKLFGQLPHLEVVTPRPAEVDYVHATYLDIVGAGVGNALQNEGLTRVAQKLMERDQVEAIILAGTDLALVFNESSTSFPHINCAQLHLNAITQRAIEL
jgi:aspartate racemase